MDILYDESVSALTRNQIIALVGFLILVAAIPFGMLLVKQSQIFSSKAAGPQVAPIIPQVATTPKEVPATSPMGALEKYLSTAAATIAPSATPTPAPASTAAVSFGPTLDFTINIEGRPNGHEAINNIFVGIAPGATSSARPNFLLSFTVNVGDSGKYSGLSLAGLDPSSIYTAYIKGPGQIDSAATFSLGPAVTKLNGGQPITLLSGDVNDDDTVNTADYGIVKGLLGKKTGDPDFNPRADFNGDGIINILDLAYITKNFGKTGVSGPWYSPVPTPPPLATSSANPAGAALNPQESTSTDSGTPAHGYWVWVP